LFAEWYLLYLLIHSGQFLATKSKLSGAGHCEF
jgi:hypothetical protein